MDANMTIEGLKYMVLGMTTVFLFLILLIYILKLQAKLLTKFFPTKSAGVTSVPPVAAASGEEEEEIIAVITAAITEYKKG
ncbi:MAG: sodium pump decarboxylase subunit gamma [Sulfurospirillum sp.]|nr:MAG: sodium pump decarboxylase subunit gamma [Sulfurospirillum sp.]